MSRLSWRERMRRMNQRSLFTAAAVPDAADDTPGGPAPLASERAEAIQRLQVGVVGIAAMVLLVGLASIIGGQVDRNDKLAVPEAAPTTEPSAVPAQANPLADAGVVPDIAAEPSAAPPPAAPAAPANAPPAP